MKKLLLIRHAKATHDNGYKDFERPLKKSGIADAELMASRLKAQDLIPQIIISSPALRAKTTANIFSEHLSLPEPHINKAIYEASNKDLFDIINGLPHKYDFIALSGHNPAIAGILYYLTGQIRDVPPCAVAVIDFEIDNWNLISEGTGNLVHYDEA